MSFIYLNFSKVILLSCVFLLSACEQVGKSVPPEAILWVDFEQQAQGSYSDEQVKKAWPKVKWSGLQDRAKIVTNTEQGQVLRIAYPSGSVGPHHNGGQFLVQLPPAKEYWLSYRVRFSKSFDFRKGGKLPGLTSGGGKYTGGSRPQNGEGWSARYMWKPGGQVMLYLYYIDMPGKWGENLLLKNVHFTPGSWHRLTQRIRVNDTGTKNARVDVWFDDKKVLARENIRLRIGEQGLIDSFYFSTFHGGNTPDWAPQTDGFVSFDDFLISIHKPEFIVLAER